jgi:hypothetical protein
MNAKRPTRGNEESTPEKRWREEDRGPQSRSKSRNKQLVNNMVSAGPSDKKKRPVTSLNAPKPKYPLNPGSSHPNKLGSAARNQSAKFGIKKVDPNLDYNNLHETLISEILKEEEEVLSLHKEHIDSMYKSSKQVGRS